MRKSNDLLSSLSPAELKLFLQSRPGFRREGRIWSECGRRAWAEQNQEKDGESQLDPVHWRWQRVGVEGSVSVAPSWLVTSQLVSFRNWLNKMDISDHMFCGQIIAGASVPDQEKRGAASHNPSTPAGFERHQDREPWSRRRPAADHRGQPHETMNAHRFTKM